MGLGAKRVRTVMNLLPVVSSLLSVVSNAVGLQSRGERSSFWLLAKR